MTSTSSVLALDICITISQVCEVAKQQEKSLYQTSLRMRQSMKFKFFCVFFYRAALRSLFKGSVSAFIPLVIFFFNITHGRTHYDKLFSTMVVDTSSLHQPLFVNGQGINQLVNLNYQRGHVHVQIR